MVAWQREVGVVLKSAGWTRWTAKGLILLLVGIAVGACAPEQDQGGAKAVIAALQSAFPLLEAMHVDHYRNQDWCKTLVYAGGTYSQTNEPATCNLFDQPARPFTAQAWADLAIVQAQLSKSGMSVLYANIDRDSATGRITQAEFDVDVSCAGCTRVAYVYEPRYALPSGPIPRETLSPLNDSWYAIFDY